MNKISNSSWKAIFLIFVFSFIGKTYAACPVIKQTTDDDFASLNGSEKSAAIYDHFIKPAFEYVIIDYAVEGVGNPLLSGVWSVNQKADFLKEVYANHKRLVKNNADLINLIDTIRNNYRGTNATFKNLTKDVALKMLNQADAQDLKTMFSGVAMCIGGLPPKFTQFEISFYGLKEEECKHLTSAIAVRGIADRIEINQISNAVCLTDYGTPWNHYGRNQVTYIIGR